MTVSENPEHSVPAESGTAGARALVVVDVQNDFCEGGSMGVDGGGAVAASIGPLVDQGGYDMVVVTRDWHRDPGEHWAPAGQDPDFATTWPVHCAAETPGAEFHPALAVTVDEIFNKGEYSASYSGFDGRADSDGTPLADWLQARSVDRIDVVGIATDYCVKATALDAHAAGFTTSVLLGHCAAVAADTGAAAEAELAESGVRVIRS